MFQLSKNPSHSSSIHRLPSRIPSLTAFIFPLPLCQNSNPCKLLALKLVLMIIENSTLPQVGGARYMQHTVMFLRDQVPCQRNSEFASILIGFFSFEIEDENVGWVGQVRCSTRLSNCMEQGSMTRVLCLCECKFDGFHFLSCSKFHPPLYLLHGQRHDLSIILWFACPRWSRRGQSGIRGR